ncbi:hypothetical protein MKX01_013276 [Papaver californicum]|nr:hypothetical protein MKX01_013276 [Papaver californicum]
MAIIASSSSLKFSNPFPSSSLKFSTANSSRSLLFFSRKATESENNESSSLETTETPTESTDTSPNSTADQDSFENKLAQVRLRYKSGTGKKAELRKGKKSKGTNGGSGGGGGGNVFLPPVPLKEPVSSGLKVEMGFSRYTERLNGRLAGLGLAALLLVELATGKSVLNYHSPSIVFIQIYFVAAVSALYIKFEKEKVSIWPR